VASFSAGILGEGFVEEAEEDGVADGAKRVHAPRKQRGSAKGRDKFRAELRTTATYAVSSGSQSGLPLLSPSRPNRVAHKTESPEQKLAEQKRNAPDNKVPGSARMTIELTPPQPELGPAPANGQGQSQGHRRRRRRRKNKSNQQGGMQAQQGQPQQAQPMQQVQPQQQQLPPQNGTPKHMNGRPDQGGGRKKKKKFFQKGSAPQPQPGNSISGPQHGRRKERQKGPRMFVGPMDHSYRAVNGNVADGPPSTIQLSSSNGHGGYYNDVNQGAPTLPVKENAPTRIFCFIEDLFFQAKIQETARKLGVKVEFVKAEKDTIARLTDAPENARPTLVVFDLNNLNAKPMTLIPKFKAKFKRATSIIGFLNHLQGDLKMKAIEAGCDTVMPRSAFSQSLPNLLRRYGMEEEEECFPQPV
jgi:hypothetical protein